MGNYRRRETRAEKIGKAVVGLVGVGIVSYGVWAVQGQPDLGVMFGFSRTPAVTQSQPSEATNEHLPAQPWSCVYDPSINEDWHDDVLCSDGVTTFRPNLLPDLEHVTEAAMRAAGQEHEDYLNAGGKPETP